MTDWVHINTQQIWMGDKGNIGVYSSRKHAINTYNTLGRPSVAAHSPSFLLDASNCSMTQAQQQKGRVTCSYPPAVPQRDFVSKTRTQALSRACSRNLAAEMWATLWKKILFFPADHTFSAGTRSGVNNHKNSSVFNHYSLVPPSGSLSTPKWTKHPTLSSLHPK